MINRGVELLKITTLCIDPVEPAKVNPPMQMRQRLSLCSAPEVGPVNMHSPVPISKDKR